MFGGNELTATDVAVAGGLIDLGDRRRVASLPADLVEAARSRGCTRWSRKAWTG